MELKLPSMHRTRPRSRSVMRPASCRNRQSAIQASIVQQWPGIAEYAVTGYLPGQACIVRAGVQRHVTAGVYSQTGADTFHSGAERCTATRGRIVQEEASLGWRAIYPLERHAHTVTVDSLAHLHHVFPGIER